MDARGLDVGVYDSYSKAGFGYQNGDVRCRIGFTCAPTKRVCRYDLRQVIFPDVILEFQPGIPCLVIEQTPPIA